MTRVTMTTLEKLEQFAKKHGITLHAPIRVSCYFGFTDYKGFYIAYNPITDNGYRIFDKDDRLSAPEGIKENYGKDHGLFSIQYSNPYSNPYNPLEQLLCWVNALEAKGEVCISDYSYLDKEGETVHRRAIKFKDPPESEELDIQLLVDSQKAEIETLAMMLRMLCVEISLPYCIESLHKKKNLAMELLEKFGHLPSLRDAVPLMSDKEMQPIIEGIDEEKLQKFREGKFK